MQLRLKNTYMSMFYLVMTNKLCEKTSMPLKACFRFFWVEKQKYHYTVVVSSNNKFKTTILFKVILVVFNMKF